MNEVKKKILIIEGNSKNLTLEEDILTVGGFEVITACDGENGIVVAQEEQPDAIIMEYKLPGINGLETKKILDANEKTKNIPIVFVTASVTNEIRAKLEECGRKIITKPINTRTFIEEISGLLK